MAKRNNPYIDDFIPQSKVHVSLKQFNNNEHRLQKIYEKTLELLFKGANRTQDENVKTNINSLAQGKKDGKKQLFIGKDGTLLHSGYTIAEDAIKDAGECLCGNLKSEYCAYCESVLCSLCLHHCLRCMQYYCSKCSLTGLDNSEICVSCYS